MIQNTPSLSPSAICRIQSFLSTQNNPYYLDVDGIHVEMRYRTDAPSLQQKVISLCNQSLVPLE